MSGAQQQNWNDCNCCRALFDKAVNSFPNIRTGQLQKAGFVKSYIYLLMNLLHKRHRFIACFFYTASMAYVKYSLHVTISLSNMGGKLELLFVLQLLIPLQFVSQSNHFSHHNHRWILEILGVS